MKKKILSSVTRLPLITLVTVLLVALFLNLSTLWAIDEIKRGEYVTSGYSCAIISSGSMEPGMLVNDLLIVESEPSYQTEDVVTYVSPQGGLITHRVKEVLGYGYITQGDANNIPDEEILNQRILGKVVFIIPGAGVIIDIILSPIGISLLGCICLLLWLIQKIRGEQNEPEQNKTETFLGNAYED